MDFILCALLSKKKKHAADTSIPLLLTGVSCRTSVDVFGLWEEPEGDVPVFQQFILQGEERMPAHTKLLNRILYCKNISLIELCNISV